MKIRKYSRSDRKDIEYIHFETGLFGSSMSRYLKRKKEFSESIRYYLEKEPESIFVLDTGDKVVGYIFGCIDESKHDEVKDALKGIFFRFFKLPFLPKTDRKYWFSMIKSLIKIIFTRSEDFDLKHPKKSAHIHINLLPMYRKKGYGTKLLREFLKYAKSKGVIHIHADGMKTRLNPSEKFWEKNGFKKFSSVKTILWKDQFPTEEIFLVCRVKVL